METEKQIVVKKPSAGAQIFGHFTKREFWIELMEGIVKASVTAFFVALGDTLIRYGKSRGGAANPDILEKNGNTNVSPAAQAFTNSQQGFSRGYTPQTSYSSVPQHQPGIVPVDGPWPGFGQSR